MINRDDNPYPDGFGVVPPVLAGRDAEFSDLTAMLRRRAAGRYEEPRLLVGDRGYGKTVLLAELAAQARQPVTVTAGTNLVVNVTAVAWHTPATPKLRGHGAQYDPATPAFIAWGRIVGLESTAASTLTSGVRQPCPLSMQPSVRSPAVR